MWRHVNNRSGTSAESASESSASCGDNLRTLALQTALSLGVLLLKASALTLLINAVRDRFRVGDQPVVAEWSLTNSIALCLMWELRDIDVVMFCECEPCKRGRQTSV